MTLRDLLLKKRTILVSKWVDVLIDSYPRETAAFLRSVKDPFANPLGGNCAQWLGVLFDELAQHMDRVTIVTYVDRIVRIRAVQNFLPSQAIEFIPLLKKIIRVECAEQLRDSRLLSELEGFESSRIDILYDIAAAIYKECKETLRSITMRRRERALRAAAMAGVCY